MNGSGLAAKFEAANDFDIAKCLQRGSRDDKGRALALPDVFTTRAGECLGGKLLFHRLLTNWTFFLPHHTDTCLFF
jgi:hypothetical protein